MPLYESPNPELYQLGKGILFMGEWNGATPPSSFVDVGNCPSMEVDLAEETLEHYSSRTGTRLKDKSALIQAGYTVNFVLDEISARNLAMFLKATLAGSSPKVIYANTALTKEYALRFKSFNPAGPQELWEFWRMKLKPNGAFSLIGDEWSTLSFTGEGLADTNNHPESPYITVVYGTTTTTSTTTTTTAP
jgi:hypothetical protein